MRIIPMSIGLISIGLLMASPSFAEIDPEDVKDGHVWLFEDVKGHTVEDDSQNDLAGTISGAVNLVIGINGKALEFNERVSLVTLPDSPHINLGGPWANRTIKIIFNCADVLKEGKQTLYEEGGLTRGLVVYVFDGDLYAGGWNRAEYNWSGTWLSAPIKSDRWYEVALILRDTKDAVEEDRFEMWLDGKLADKGPGGQLYVHEGNIGIGGTNQHTLFHDKDGTGNSRDYFMGLIDEVWVLNESLTAGDLKPVEPVDKLAAAWGGIKAQH